jgi:O-methyltransferase
MHTPFLSLRRFVRRQVPSLAELVATVWHRTYMADGLITRHCADFQQDIRFLAAYNKGKATGSWMNMDPRWRVYTACWAAAHAASIAGDFVECGVNRGGMARAIVEYVNFNRLGKRFFLLDTYQGFPAGAQASSATAGLYSDCYDEVVETFAPYPGVRIVRGVVPETLDAVDSMAISYLSIDMNSAEPEVEAVRRLWSRLACGAVVLLDDYGGGPAFSRQKNMLDALSKELAFTILALPTGQGLIVKS